jgi:hypothetical protein
MYTPEIDKDKLRAFYSSHPVARPVLEYFSTCRTSEFVITVDDLLTNFQKKRYLIPRQDIVNIFKGLEEIGCGEFKNGRRTQKSRFLSIISLDTIGKAVVGDKTEDDKVDNISQRSEEHQQQPELSTKNDEDTEEDESVEVIPLLAINQEGLGNLLPHSFRLRPHLLLSLNLPRDLTVSEAERLSNFSKTLPFDK